MNKAMISQLQAMQQLAAAAAGRSGTAAAPGSEDFLDLLQQSLAAVNDRQQEADHRVQQVQTGRSSDLLGAVLSLEEADLSFQLLLQVRNKAVKAYEEIMRMQL
jgi:flagellar hook-basal body complex protein FliE